MKSNWSGLAVDLGASGGRVIAGCFDGSCLSLNEVHRFANEPVQLSDTLYWDFLRLFFEVGNGLRKGSVALKEQGREVKSLGIDSWGVDFGLLDAAGRLIASPVHYRDRRNDGVMDRVFQQVTPNVIYQNTGIQFLPFNTLYQLMAIKQKDIELLQRARSLLMIPDLFHYFLSGEKIAEFTNSTTTQLLDPRTRDWSHDLLDLLQLPGSLFQNIVQPASLVGKLTSSMREELGGFDPDIVAVATHDTGSAVAAVPALEDSFAYLSCGTWSLLGTEVKEPILNPEAMEQNFTNEGGVEGTYRFLKNMTGLWLLQETKRTWEKSGRQLNWNQMTEMAQSGKPFSAFIDPDDSIFLSPGNMPERVRQFCQKTGQSIPAQDSDVLRCITESLALKCRKVFELLQNLTSKQFKVLHIVGGGIQNELLCQWIANSLGIPVLAGPIEATAIGNLGVQLLALGEAGSLTELRQILARSFQPKRYEPTDKAAWDDVYQAFNKAIS